MGEIFAKRLHHHDGIDSPRLRFSDLWFDSETPSSATIIRVVEDAEFESLDTDAIINQGDIWIKALDSTGDTTVYIENPASADYVAHLEVEGDLGFRKLKYDLIPAASNLSLGSSGEAFYDLWLSHTLHLDAGSLVDGDLIPAHNAVHDLGSTGQYWRSAYFAESIKVGGLETKGDIIPSTSGLTLGTSGLPFYDIYLDHVLHLMSGSYIDGDLIPSIHGGFDLGSSGMSFHNIYITGEIDGMDPSAHIADVNAHIDNLIDIPTRDHDLLGGLEDDDHLQYVHTSIARTIGVAHTFNPPTIEPAFYLGPNARDQLIDYLNADQLDGYHQYDFAHAVHASNHEQGGSDSLSAGVPVDIGTANSSGTAVNYALSDHVHAHPSGLGENLHHNRSHDHSNSNDGNSLDPAVFNIPNQAPSPPGSYNMWAGYDEVNNRILLRISRLGNIYEVILNPV